MLCCELPFIRFVNMVLDATQTFTHTKIMEIKETSTFVRIHQGELSAGFLLFFRQTSDLC